VQNYRLLPNISICFHFLIETRSTGGAQSQMPKLKPLLGGYESERISAGPNFGALLMDFGYCWILETTIIAGFREWYQPNAQLGEL